MTTKKVLVLGSTGQVGTSLKKICTLTPNYEYKFTDKTEIDISDAKSLAQIRDLNINAIINAAAYTAVDLAETDFTKAWSINTESPKLISKLCNELCIPFIHFSSDYVYDNGFRRPLKETDSCSPKSVYAITKFEGEQAALFYNPKTIILRTSWVYSESGANFVKTMLKLTSEKAELNVVHDQIGAPTYARDLALVVLKMLDQILTKQDFNDYGIYNYANAGQISWFDFASEIAKISNSNCLIKPVNTSAFPRPALRPPYSVFDMTKIKSLFFIQPVSWQDSLKICIKNLS